MPRLQAVWPQPLLPHPGGVDGTLTCCDMLWHVVTCCDMLWQCVDSDIVSRVSLWDLMPTESREFLLLSFCGNGGTGSGSQLQHMRLGQFISMKPSFSDASPWFCRTILQCPSRFELRSGEHSSVPIFSALKPNGPKWYRLFQFKFSLSSLVQCTFSL